MSRPEEWTWMPHPAHFICARDCRFHLATEVGGYLISTIGEYLPDSQVREILAKSRGIILEGKGDARLADWMKKHGYEEIGYGRKYETFVFKSVRREGEGAGCCPFTAADWIEIDGRGYNDSSDAFKGHLEACAKWSRSEVPA